MTRTAITLAESAIGDLEELLAWYEDQGAAQAGVRLVEGVFDRIEALAEHPDLGRVVPEFDQNFLRELVEPPLRIVYRRDPDQVRIVRVWRSERLLKLP